GRDAVAVADLDDVAVAALLADELHHAVARAADLGAGRGREIDALVLAGVLEDRVHAGVAEARRNAAELDRVLQERLAQAASVEREVFAFAPFAALEPHRLVTAAVDRELHRQDPADRRRIEAVGLADDLVDHAQRVAAAQVAGEIDLAIEDVGDLAGDRLRNSRGVDRGEQGGLDLGDTHGDLPLEHDRLLARLDPVAVATDRQPASGLRRRDGFGIEVAEAVLERLHAPGLVDLG